MNKIHNINIGGYPLTIDDDAYQYLENYLDNIRQRFSESDGREEIMNDVESRLGELLTANLGGRSIVMLPDVESVVAIMGKPEDFGGEPTATAEPKSRSKSGQSATGQPLIKTGKRLFRDEENTVISGVCSGLAAYFGMPEPVWMRLIFVLLAIISAGFWVPVYLLLWIIVPPARSASDRLQMRGEPVNVDSIARELEQGINRVSKRFDSDARPVFNAPSSQGCGAVIGKLALGILILIAASMVFGLGTAWIASAWAILTESDRIVNLSPLGQSSTYLGMGAFFLFFGLPIVSLLVWLSRQIFNTQAPKWLGATLGSLWGVSLLVLLFLGYTASREYRRQSTQQTELDLNALTSDTLRISKLDTGYEDDIIKGDFFFNDDDDKFEFRNSIDIRVRRSQSNRFECIQYVTSRGKTNENALENASFIEVPYQVRPSGELAIASHFKVNDGKKWRFQRVKIVIGVPEGKYIVFGDKIYSYAAADLDDYATGNGNYYISKRPNRLFEMTSGGLRCVDCSAVGSNNEYDTDEEYGRFVFEGNLEVEIRKSERFRVNADERKGISIIESGNTLTISADNNLKGRKVKVIIETRGIDDLTASNNCQLTLRGFEENDLALSARNNAQISAFVDVNDELSVNVSGNSQITLQGRGNRLTGSISNNAQLEAAGYRAETVDLSATNNAQGAVNASENVNIQQDNNSQIRVDGGATVNKNRD
jgi:phage shock protein PspC (stress-responsive transcriptional regulator)